MGIVMHSGGVVPGRPGQEVPVILNAGERVAPLRQITCAEADCDGCDGTHHTIEDS